MRSGRSDECAVCGPFIEETVMVEFEDNNEDDTAICVDCLMGIFTSIDMPQDAMNAFAEAWASDVLGTNVVVVNDDSG